MNDILAGFLILVVWIILQSVVFPRLGIQS